MAGRIPMKGDPKPLDREAMAAELATSLVRMRTESKRQLAEAEVAGDQGQIKELRKELAKIEKLEKR